MSMNEYGEIVRSETTVAATESSAEDYSGYSDSFSNEVEERFLASRKRNFKLITLFIGIPIYVVLGYFAPKEYVFHEYANETSATIICAIAALIIMLIYNNVFAKEYKGVEYLVSLLSPGIVLAAIVCAKVIVMFIKEILIELLKAIVGIIIVIVIIAGILGG